MIALTSASFIWRAGSAQDTTERIDVWARDITVTLPPPYGRVTGYHLYIVYADASGRQFVCEGFPFYPPSGSIPPESALFFYGPPGLLTQGYCATMPHGRPAGAHSVTVLQGADAGRAYRCMEKETARFNSENVAYRMATGPNSNSFVRTMLDRCGVPAIKPAAAVPSPGWDISIR